MEAINVEVRKTRADTLAYEFNKKLDKYKAEGYKVISVNYYERKEYNYGGNISKVGYQILLDKEEKDR